MPYPKGLFGSPEERFWAKVDKDGPITSDPLATVDTNCWLWTGAIREGYGAFGDGGKVWGSHAWIYHYETGVKSSQQYTIDHLCRVRNCVRFDHLELVPSGVNTARGLHPIMGHDYFRNKTECVNGHKLSGENLYIKPNGNRGCFSCRRTRSRLWHAVKRDSKLNKQELNYLKKVNGSHGI